MNKKINKILKSILISLFLFLSPLVVNAAGSATTGFSGNNSVYVGQNIEVILYIGSVSGTTNNEGLAAFGGTISYPTDKLELVSRASLGPFNVDMNGNKLGGFGQNTIKGRSNIMKFVFRAKALGNATISYSGSSQPDASASPVAISASSKTISIVNPPSSNNNLSSLSISNGSINFNKNTTNYSVTVDSGVTSVNVSAQAEDGGARISGLGNRGLNYGNNSIVVTVTAANGAQKNYTINVNRKDNRSGNNNLGSLSVNGGELSPAFNANTTNYNVSVPFSIDNLKVNATVQDGKSHISISDTSLVAEETRSIYITVTAENGAQKTYTINAHRGKDPNKVLSTNNFLSKLNPSSGVLSPGFNREHENYIVYVPYEVDRVTFETDVEDKKYATVKIEGPESLEVGNNSYKIIVTAEDNSTKTYSVTVSRGINMTGESLSSNIYLKEIKIKKGSLKEKFDKKIFSYKYTGGKIEAIPEDENSEVNIIENDDSAIIMVKSQSGEVGIYTLILSKVNVMSIIIYVVLSLLVIGAFVGGYFIGKNNILDKKNLNKKKKAD